MGRALSTTRKRPKTQIKYCNQNASSEAKDAILTSKARNRATSTTKNNFEAPVWASHVNLDALQEEIRIYGLHGTFEAMERRYSFIHFRERYFEAQRVQFHRLIPYSSQSMS